MFQGMRSLMRSNAQTKYFFLMAIAYFVTIVWTTLQAYARLEYSRSDLQKPIVIQADSDEKS